MEKGSREKKVNKDKDQLDSGDEVLNVIKIVRVRVCAQVDLMMGEDVAILTRMLSYDDRFMMRAALRAGEMMSSSFPPIAGSERGKLERCRLGRNTGVSFWPVRIEARRGLESKDSRRMVSPCDVTRPS